MGVEFANLKLHFGPDDVTHPDRPDNLERFIIDSPLK
jgi:hypothetical protein